MLGATGKGWFRARLHGAALWGILVCSAAWEQGSAPLAEGLHRRSPAKPLEPAHLPSALLHPLAPAGGAELGTAGFPCLLDGIELSVQRMNLIHNPCPKTPVQGGAEGRFGLTQQNLLLRARVEPRQFNQSHSCAPAAPVPSAPLAAVQTHGWVCSGPRWGNSWAPSPSRS